LTAEVWIASLPLAKTIDRLRRRERSIHIKTCTYPHIPLSDVAEKTPVLPLLFVRLRALFRAAKAPLRVKGAPNASPLTPNS
jgi:hypothetical protein